VPLGMGVRSPLLRQRVSPAVLSARGMNLAISKSMMPYLFGVRMQRALIGIYEIQREDSR